jgi:outer membrane cobalamin receptor
MVPGVNVARINAHTWAVTVRGFNGRFNNKLLVLMDGRTVYTPNFGGVVWDVLDLPLSNVERIEVIRGPGGSVWGANAANGVINIITRKLPKPKAGCWLQVTGILNKDLEPFNMAAKRARARTTVSTRNISTKANSPVPQLPMEEMAGECFEAAFAAIVCFLRKTR